MAIHDGPAALLVGKLDEERYEEDVGCIRLLELPESVAWPKARTVIGREDNEGFVVGADFFELADHLADELIREPHLEEESLPGLAHEELGPLSTPRSEDTRPRVVIPSGGQ